VTGPGDVERDKKGEGVREGFRSLAPSIRTGIAGEGGLLVAEDWLLPEGLPNLNSVAPSFCTSFVAGVATFGELFPVGVPN
jgi:hypothetical protein